MTTEPRALTLDLDDTLWPVWPAIGRAEAVLHEWLALHAPRTAAGFDAAGLRAVRVRVEATHPHLHHDLSALRLESLRLALRESGEDVALAQPAFDVFFAERQRVDLFPDVRPALQRLAARFPLLAVSNGNADVHRIGLGEHFVGSVSAQSCGFPKPDRRIFEAACRQLGVDPARVLHVGDDLAMDIEGALAAGLQAAWIYRLEAVAAEPPHGATRWADLTALADHLGC